MKQKMTVDFVIPVQQTDDFVFIDSFRRGSN